MCGRPMTSTLFRMNQQAPGNVQQEQVSEATVRPAVTTARLVGIDVARGLAVLGMFAAHVGPPDPGNWLHQLVAGRSAVLFAVLAGVSLALLSGRSEPAVGADLRRTRIRIAVRAAVLFVLGLALVALDTPVAVILPAYAALFLLAIPMLRVRPAILGALAATLAVAGPLASYAIRGVLPSHEVIPYTPSVGDLTSWHGLGTLAQGLLIDGTYPVLTWLPFILAGMAVGRLDLSATATRVRLLAGGSGLAVLGYGGSWLALHTTGAWRHLSVVVDQQFGGEVPVDALVQGSFGVPPTIDPAVLLLAGPHSGTPFEIVGSAGVALAVIAACLLGADRLLRTLRPLASVGALALTAYTAHLVAIALIGAEQVQGTVLEHPYLVLGEFAATALVAATLWRHFVGRGPLEGALHRISVAAAR